MVRTNFRHNLKLTIHLQVLNFISDFGKFGSFEFGWPQPNVSVSTSHSPAPTSLTSNRIVTTLDQGIYPTLIILLVALQRSTPDAVFTDSAEFRKTLEPMHFREASLTRKSRRRPDDFSDSDLFNDTHIGVVSTRVHDSEHDSAV